MVLILHVRSGFFLFLTDITDLKFFDTNLKIQQTPPSGIPSEESEFPNKVLSFLVSISKLTYLILSLFASDTSLEGNIVNKTAMPPKLKTK